MRYDEFRDQLEAALQRNSLHFHGLQRVETIELANTVRHWKVYAHGAAPPSTEPFHVSAEIGFAWSPFVVIPSQVPRKDQISRSSAALRLARASFRRSVQPFSHSSLR